DVRPARAHVAGLHRLDGGSGANGHKGGGADFAALHGDGSGAGAAVGGVNGERETGGHFLSLGRSPLGRSGPVGPLASTAVVRMVRASARLIAPSRSRSKRENRREKCACNSGRVMRLSLSLSTSNGLGSALRSPSQRSAQSAN